MIFIFLFTPKYTGSKQSRRCVISSTVFHVHPSDVPIPTNSNVNCPCIKTLIVQKEIKFMTGTEFLLASKLISSRNASMCENNANQPQN